MDNRQTLYDTIMGCCTAPTDTLLAESFFAHPTLATAEAIAAMLNERGYRVSAEELMDEV